MSVCTFFGHSECYGLDAAVLRSAIEELIEQGITEFVVGNHGQFDGKADAVLWDCICDCGTQTTATTAQLRSGHKKSCGCLKRASHAKDITGQRFGMLTVMKRIGTNKHRKALWRCKCDCGKTTIVASVDLVTGNTKSCGCLGNHFAKRNLLEGGFYGKNKF